MSAIFALTVCAMLSGARSLYAIAQWGRDTPSWPSLWGSAVSVMGGDKVYRVGVDGLRFGQWLTGQGK